MGNLGPGAPLHERGLRRFEENNIFFLLTKRVTKCYPSDIFQTRYSVDVSLKHPSLICYVILSF